MADGVLQFDPEIRPLPSTSPTRFTYLQACALREVWSANAASQLLPSAPAARLGTVAHRLVQEAGEGRFTEGDEASIEQRWQELLSNAEQKMRDSWLERHLTPLRDSVPDYEVRRLRARQRALEISAAAALVPDKPPIQQPTKGGRSYGFELPVASPDGLVRGRIDAVLFSEDGPVIRDYKSGAIFESGPGRSLKLKTNYKVQLELYAALYAASRGRWPARLEVVPLVGPAQLINTTEETCLHLLAQARTLLREVNSAIVATANRPSELQKRLAVPSPTNCSYCPYRPGCTPYRLAASTARQGTAWPKDVWGYIEDIRQLGNSKLLVTVHDQERNVRIRGVTPDAARHPALPQLRRGCSTAFFNLRSAGSENSLLETQFSVIYAMP